MKPPMDSVNVLLLFVFNALVFVGSLVLIVQALTLGSLPPEEYSPSFSTFIALFNFIGMFLIFLSLLLCCGLLTCSSFYLFIYVVIMIVFVMLQMFFAYIVFHEGPKFKNQLSKASFEDHSHPAKTDHEIEERSKFFEHSLNAFQRKHHCCGINGPDDWKKMGDFIPGSCCRHLDEHVCDETDLKYVQSCRQVFEGKFNGHLHTLQAAIIALLASQILSVIFTCCVLYA